MEAAELRSGQGRQPRRGRFPDCELFRHPAEKRVGDGDGCVRSPSGHSG